MYTIISIVLLLMGLAVLLLGIKRFKGGARKTLSIALIAIGFLVVAAGGVLLYLLLSGRLILPLV